MAQVGFVPGAVVANRYRLVAPHGARPRLQFWQAVEIMSAREVALTLVDPGGELPAEFVHEILARTVRLKGIDMAGVARVFDVLHTGQFGVVACEWIHGGSLREIADTDPSPAGVASAMQSLAAAAEAAHRAGLVLSIDDPCRLRISADGHAALAFPAVMPEASTKSDLRGIGEALYALLVNRSRSNIPFLISTTVTALLREDDGISSAATLLTLLRQASAEAADESNCRIMAPLDPPPPGFYAGFRNFGPAEQRQAARAAVLRGGLGVAAAILVVAVLALASSLNGFLGDNDDTVAMDADKLGLNTTSPAPLPAAPAPANAVPGARVQLASAAVFSPDGSPDSPEDAGLAIDGKPDTAWATDRYYDADPFPKFKSGVGLLVQLRAATPISAVTVDLNSTGTVAQVRSADGPAPKALAETTELSPPTPMRPGHNRIPVTDSAPVSHVLVWISTLGSADGQHRSALSEVAVHAASPPA